MFRARFALVLLIATLLARPLRAETPHNTLTPQEIAEGWILLFDGQTTFGWQPASKANWKVAEGVISVSEGEPGLLNTTSQFADYLLKVDFRCPVETNSGIFLRTPERPTDPKADCYELNIAAPAISPFPTGSFVGRQKSEASEVHDRWRTFEVEARGDHFLVKLDGRQVLDYRDPKPLARGRIGLQLNKGAVEFRNVKLKPLGLADIFNGKDLAGWKVFPGRKSQFSVTPEGTIRVKNGPGQLESQGQYGDFVLQLDVLVHGKHLNSGMFFRAIPGEYTQGYESQIHNGYRDGDRSKPIDGGTGGIYRRQNARRVVADDGQWFTKTLVVTGNHMAAWVNGYQVSDWTDTRPPHDNPRQGLRTAAGSLAIQGHDPTTDLEFRRLRIQELPANASN
jgi:hypothetical protein